MIGSIVPVTSDGCGRWSVLRSFLIAWQFLTAIPLSRTHHEPGAQELASSLSWYPFVGFLIGGALAGVDLLLSLVFHPPVVNAVVLAMLVWVTRGLHQDGLADTLDGLVGGRNKEERLRIMRDPAIGALGATGLFLSLIIRYAGLTVLPQDLRMPALIAMPAVGRWSMVLLVRMSPPARPEGGLAGPFLIHVSWRHVGMATVVLLTGLGLGLGVVNACLVVIGGMGAVCVARQWFCRQIGGVTGDTLGATNEVVEMLFILLVPLFAWLS